MPLSAPSPREDSHHRRIDCRGYLRADGLWDVEGHLVDIKSADIETRHRGRVEAGTPIHEMWIRLTIDEDMTVQEVEAVIDTGPFPLCPGAAPNFKALEGLQIGAGWNRSVRERVGATHGCTHLTELLAQLATTAYQTLFSRHQGREAGNGGARRARPRHLDTCYALASHREVVRELWPEFYTGG